MAKSHSINYNDLSNTIEKRFHKLSDVKDRLIKVAFDVVRFRDAPPDELWQIQSADDGEFIVAKYELDAPEEKIANASRCPWDITISYNDINVFYKGAPIAKLASSKLGVKASDLPTIKQSLPSKLASDKALVKALLNELSPSVRNDLLKQHPELV